MKTLLIAAMAALTINLSAAELPKIDWSKVQDNTPAAPAPEPFEGGGSEPIQTTEKSDSWWTDVSVSPYGAVKHVGFKGKGILGAGLDAGYQINRTVGLHVANTIWDAPDTECREGGWNSGLFIDETEALCRADLIQGGGKGKDRFVAFILTSGGYEWNQQTGSLGMGGGFDIRFSKNLSAGVDYRFRALIGGTDNEKGPSEHSDGMGRVRFVLQF